MGAPLVAALASLDTEPGGLGPFWASGLLIALPLRTTIAARRSTDVLR